MSAPRKWTPTFIKPAIRFVYYPQERKKILREISIRKIQNKNIALYGQSATKLVIFLIPGANYDTGLDKISGGIISIVSLCEESRKLKNIHGAEVLLVTFPGEHLIAKLTQFKNDTDLFRYEQLGKYFKRAEEIILHLPEYLCNHFVNLYKLGRFNWLNGKKKIQINILNQNIRFMPSPEEIGQLKNLATQVTITTAHQQYCNQTFRDLYGVPVHKFSVWISPENYYFKPYEQKENLMIVSPDGHPEKDSILATIAAETGIRIQVIQNLTYEQYKVTISRAKWALTFGEGLDGYLIEPIFSGAVSFAVYNEEFFTSDFKGLLTLYSSLEVLKKEITADIHNLDNESNYREYQKTQFALCAKYYSEEVYRRNIADYYKGNYTFC